jgi:hypothetical protein
MSRRHNKMGAKRCEIQVDGNQMKFPSHLERDRYLHLHALQAGGAISDLHVQVEFSCDVNGAHVCSYVADFTYKDTYGKPVVEDAKGFITREFRLKKKLAEACWKMKIRCMARDKTRGWYEKIVRTR